jgi:hypothetical protein
MRLHAYYHPMIRENRYDTNVVGSMILRMGEVCNPSYTHISLSYSSFGFR